MKGWGHIMINIDNVEVVGWESAIRGMRNPMNSWSKSDSFVCNEMLADFGDCPMVMNDCESAKECHDGKLGYCIGVNDFELMKKLCKAGTDHRKFMRMIVVYADVYAPRYWWAEYDTYKIGTVANSCSTMHKIHDKEFTLDDFSCEELYGDFKVMLMYTIVHLNLARENYNKFKDKKYWWQMIQLLPSSYNQKRTIMLNYEVLANIYKSRKNHKLDEWHEFCKWIELLPYSELITGGFDIDKKQTDIRNGKINQVVTDEF